MDSTISLDHNEEQAANTLCGSTWTERDKLLVEYYWLKGEHAVFIARTVDRSAKAVENIIREIKRGYAKPRKRIVLHPRPYNYARVRGVAA